MTNVWDFWARYYDSLWVQRYSLKPTRTEILRHILPDKPIAILDVGCGTGQLYTDLCQHFGSVRFTYLGIDRSEQMLHQARAKHPEANFSHVSADDFDDQEQAYDVIVCSHAFPYFDDKPGFLSRSASMLADGGVFLLAQASVNSVYDALVMKGVALTTSRARYCSRREINVLGSPVFGASPKEIRINRSIMIPSILLFKWQKEEPS